MLLDVDFLSCSCKREHPHAVVTPSVCVVLSSRLRVGVFVECTNRPRFPLTVLCCLSCFWLRAVVRLPQHCDTCFKGHTSLQPLGHVIPSGWRQACTDLDRHAQSTCCQAPPWCLPRFTWIV